MDELRTEVREINKEFADFQGKLASALKMLEGTREHAPMAELSDSLLKAHEEFAKTAEPAIAWMADEQKKLQAEIDRTQAEIAELQKRLQAVRAEAAKPKASPPPPLVPGEGDPRYGEILGDELLDLLGRGPAPTEKPRLGEVWELESVDWKASAAAPPAAAPEQVKPKPKPPTPRAPGGPESLGGMDSQDWDGGR